MFLSDRAESFKYELYIMDRDGQNVSQITRTSAYNARPTFVPGGDGVLFLSDQAVDRFVRYGLWSVNADGSGARMLTDRRLFDAPLQWKP